MKVTASLSLLFGLAALAQAQTLKPSPTESVGCVPHGDHWDCEGPSVTATGSQPTPTSEHADHDDDDDHHDVTAVVPGASTVTLAPSPTESFGCKAHGDHWDCEGSVTSTPTTAAGTATAAGSASTAGAGRSQVTGLAAAGLAAAAVVLAI